MLTIHVATAFDDRMAVAGLVLAKSIAGHAKAERAVVLHVLYTNQDKSLSRALARLTRPNFTCVLHDPGNVYAQYEFREPFTRATLFRLTLSTLLPEISKVIYLDADTIVLRDLAELYDLAIPNLPLAAMPDYPLYYYELLSPIATGTINQPAISYLTKRLNLTYDSPESYFNSGVMLINLNYWRSHDTAGDCCRILEANRNLHWADQDALNIACNGRYQPIDSRWNAFAGKCRQPSPYGTFPALAALQQIWSKDPWIVHYSSNHKPWRADHLRTIHDWRFWREAVTICEGRELMQKFMTATLRGSRIQLPRFGRQPVVLEDPPNPKATPSGVMQNPGRSPL